MNILIVNFEYPPLGGGGAVSTRQMAEELSKRHNVHVLTTKYKNLPGSEVVNGVTIHRVSVLGRNSLPTASLVSLLIFAPVASLVGLRILKKIKFDVINAQFVIPSGVPAAWLAWLFHVPLVVSFIGGDIYDPTKGISPHRHAILRLAIRSVVKHARLCTAISQDTKKRAQDLHGVRKEIVVTPLGLMHSTEPKTTKQQAGLPPEGLVAISIGRLIPRKSYHILLQAWQDVPSNASLVIIGDGPLKKDLEDWTKKYGLQKRVHLAGFVSEEQKRQMLLNSDIYVSAAEHEGFGIVFLEAMDAGLPIVAINEGGQIDFLEHNKHALLVPPHDPKKIAQAVTQLVNNPDLRHTFSTNNKEKVKEFYLEKTVRAFEEVLLKAATPL